MEIEQINVFNLITIFGFFLSIIAICISYKALKFSKISRKNDKKPYFVYKDSYGGYFDIEKRIPKVFLEFANRGGRADNLQIVNLTGNCVFYIDKINDSVNNDEDFIIQVCAKEVIKHEEMGYEFKIIASNVDNDLYEQSFVGKGIFVKKSYEN